ncbi:MULTISPECIES: diguanylate cyclase CdgB [Streptomyces]|uniref:Diguanylate cyclase CdgB n=1 Tax=Streptomyces katrae TaxID=68223 RepID=A0ABT7GYY9_9ACTN|nr:MULTISPECIES: diguanylate cyclase CdgB [Streptomyces]MDK9498449.1 diguanylate cyclase CdgB [Streptomyces katrae]RST07267.1 diguanylate cyclase [Streptomyces sp. WAC07149]GLX18974.1 diguanylate cyclase [Streptomyces lavendulae subsp. lavendulae]GLX31139.1 diguanylate cyclase [Streptomyces lavendulae subsp. lavendulae]
METESEPYVRLATLRQLHQVVAELNTARSLADTLQTVVDGIVRGLGYELACVNLVRPDGDLVVAAFAGDPAAEALITGRVGSRPAWERRLTMGEDWDGLRFIPHTEGWVLMEDDVPQWHTDGPDPRFRDEWHPEDRLYAPMYATGGELLGVISVDRPRNGRRPGAWGREALQMYAFQAAIAISNARLRANMQRALVRLEREQQALRASEESFRQAFEYAPSGMAIAEMGGDQHGRLLRTNDALCRLLGRPASVLRRYSFSDLVHPEDIGTLLRTSAEGGRAELRLGRRDGTYVWVSLRNSVVADAADGPRFLLTHVEDIEERKRHELQLAHRASHDSLTGLPNSAELRSRLGARLCRRPQSVRAGAVEALDAAYEGRPEAGGAGEHGFPPEGQHHGQYHAYDDGGFPAAPAPGQAADAFDFPGAFPGSPDGPYDHHVHTVAPATDVDDGTKGLAVLFCDLDGFKSINDRFGHHTGDAVLIEVARRLTTGVRDGDTVARLGGDEFVVLADGLGAADAADLAVRLRNAIIPPIRVDGRAVRVGASFGIGWASCGMSADEVLRSADQRMYIEKRSRSKAHRRAG